MKPMISKDKVQAARDISYTSSAQSTAGRLLIKTIENTTGRMRLIRRADGYAEEVSRGRSFWRVLMQRYGLSIQTSNSGLENLPTHGPLIIVANHPFGILDGLVMGAILDDVRGDFRILANSVFTKSEELNRIVLPISFDETREAQKTNIQTRKVALDYLAQGGAIGVFPGGTVSTSRTLFSTPMDPRWRRFTARMITKSGATVVPIHFSGHNSRLFQIASHISPTLRLALLIRQFGRRVDQPVQVTIGQPIPNDDLQKFAGDGAAMMDFLRQATYALSPVPLGSYALGYEFEEKHKD